MSETMTCEEAIEQLRKMKPIGEKCAEACDVAIEALEKQIPKKIRVYNSHPETIYLCGSCGSTFVRRFAVYNYCANCGQRINDEEENK